MNARLMNPRRAEGRKSISANTQTCLQLPPLASPSRRVQGVCRLQRFGRRSAPGPVIQQGEIRSMHHDVDGLRAPHRYVECDADGIGEQQRWGQQDPLRMGKASSNRSAGQCARSWPIARLLSPCWRGRGSMEAGGRAVTSRSLAAAALASDSAAASRRSSFSAC